MMQIRLDDEAVKAAVIEQVIRDLSLDPETDEVTVVRFTRRHGGGVECELVVEPQ